MGFEQVDGLSETAQLRAMRANIRTALDEYIRRTARGDLSRQSVSLRQFALAAVVMPIVADHVDAAMHAEPVD